MFLLQQPDELPLEPARLHAMDGCSSPKRLDGSSHADEQLFPSRYHIPPSEVNRFSDDVQTRTSDMVPSDDYSIPCTDNWASAHAISEETTKVFDQTGVFLTACRHGIIETIIEMRRSGEL
jgi:hypothetical protein